MARHKLTIFKLIGLSMLFCFSLHISAEPEVTVKSLMDKDSKVDAQDESSSKGEEEVKQVIKAAAVSSAVKEKGEELDIDSLPYDEFHRITPSSSMQAYLKAARNRDFNLATHYLDYRNLPPEVKVIAPELLAEQLSLVFDRTVWIDVDTLSKKPEGKKMKRCQVIEI